MKKEGRRHLTHEEWVELSGEDGLLFAKGLDAAIIGIGRRCGEAAAVVYDVNKVYKILQETEGLDYIAAVEHVEYNIFGGWVGEQTPVWVDTAVDDRLI